MGLRTYRTFQALILGALGVWLLFKVSDGRILLYINQRFVILVLLAAVGLVLLAQVVLSARPVVETADAEEHAHGERHAWALWLVALPLLIGLLVPERPLGTSAINNRGINTGSGRSSGGESLWSSGTATVLTPAERSVFDWVQALNAGLPVAGEQADVTGFVYHDARLPEDSFLVGRFAIACCVADATAYGMAVSWPGGGELPDNSWVRVRGPVQLMTLPDNREIAVVQAEQVEQIPEPAQPYLFP